MKFFVLYTLVEWRPTQKFWRRILNLVPGWSRTASGWIWRIWKSRTTPETRTSLESSYVNQSIRTLRCRGACRWTRTRKLQCSMFRKSIPKTWNPRIRTRKPLILLSLNEVKRLRRLRRWSRVSCAQERCMSLSNVLFVKHLCLFSFFSASVFFLTDFS